MLSISTRWRGQRPRDHKSEVPQRFLNSSFAKGCGDLFNQIQCNGVTSKLFSFFVAAIAFRSVYIDNYQKTEKPYWLH